MTWHKLDGDTIALTRSTLPASERLPDGRWVSGFNALPADDPLVAEAGWVQSSDPTEQPNTSRIWRWAWTANNGAVSGSWVDDGPVPPPPVDPAIAAAEILAEADELAPALPADLADILARAAAALRGEA